MFSRLYIDYLVHFHSSRDYFECHELLEEMWKKNGQKDTTLVGLIQIAVGLYHQRRGNTKGATRLLSKSLTVLNKRRVEELGLDYNELITIINDQITNIENFNDLNLPIQNKKLFDTCVNRSEELGFTWLSPSDTKDKDLIYRHKLRDRTDVVRERYLSLFEKRVSKGNILFFDGVCNLCSGLVHFILPRDKKEIISFSSLQSNFCEYVFEHHNIKNKTDSIVYVRKGKFYTKSTAAIFLAYDLGGWLSPFIIFLAVPHFFRDLIYNFIAKNRYKWFGKEEQCMIPQKKWKYRFLE